MGSFEDGARVACATAAAAGAATRRDSREDFGPQHAFWTGSVTAWGGVGLVEGPSMTPWLAGVGTIGAETGEAEREIEERKSEGKREKRKERKRKERKF